MQLIDKTVGAIRAAENLTDDRRKLMLIGSAEAIAELCGSPGAKSLWMEPPSCFMGHPSIVGSFAGVPVGKHQVEGLSARSFALMLNKALIAVIEF